MICPEGIHLGTDALVEVVNPSETRPPLRPGQFYVADAVSSWTLPRRGWGGVKDRPHRRSRPRRAHDRLRRGRRTGVASHLARLASSAARSVVSAIFTNRNQSIAPMQINRFGQRTPLVMPHPQGGNSSRRSPSRRQHPWALYGAGAMAVRGCPIGGPSRHVAIVILKTESVSSCQNALHL